MPGDENCPRDFVVARHHHEPPEPLIRCAMGIERVLSNPNAVHRLLRSEAIRRAVDPVQNEAGGNGQKM